MAQDRGTCIAVFVSAAFVFLGVLFTLVLGKVILVLGTHFLGKVTNVLAILFLGS